MWLQINAFESLLASSGLAAAFVGSLYVWKQDDRTRDHPDVIKQRLLSIAVVCILAPFVLLVWATDRMPDGSVGGPGFSTWLGVPAPASFGYYVSGILSPLLLTAILFIGPLVMLTGVFDQPGSDYDSDESETSRLSTNGAGASAPAGTGGAPAPAREWVFIARLRGYASQLRADSSLRWIAFRNLIVAPVCEELVFRACICSLLIAGGWGFAWTVLGSPLLFGLAHLHHLIGLVRVRGYSLVNGLVAVTFQLFYTTLFGAFAGFVYLRTGHLAAPIVCHTFCNAMGFPDLSFMREKEIARKLSILGIHVLGIIGFSYGLYPLTAFESDCFFGALYSNGPQTLAQSASATINISL